MVWARLGAVVIWERKYFHNMVGAIEVLLPGSPVSEVANTPVVARRGALSMGWFDSPPFEMVAEHLVVELANTIHFANSY